MGDVVSVVWGVKQQAESLKVCLSNKGRKSLQGTERWWHVFDLTLTTILTNIPE